MKSLEPSQFIGPKDALLYSSELPFGTCAVQPRAEVKQQIEVALLLPMSLV